ncbi:MAG: hypothetical protein PWR27_1262 [Petroclostridium sp.]|jgi:RimJ/RimL family protein N-acetyltransferase|uniref:GNAT family N-acetyltransferase n=1 Tax=Petroclostridium xylanilyticum TaxID=1792311 RepID=UPI000B98CD39|nr:GNAT family N-acetyltransferase [Petroclostridium xylanilyticum]MBZ4644688.1 GCN5-related N-acetyltransferase [Clostridia bacterium]MDK2810553.1 hypothetical protein [Petroclostridium sp.]
MLSLNIDCEDIILKDIKRSDLPAILKWYNMTEKYKYATGIDKPISLQNLVEKYLEVLYCESEFFAGIYLKRNNCLIGLMKGRLKKKEANAVWISSFLIDCDYQGCGYGKKSLNIVANYFKLYHSINTIYISVIMENSEGIRFWCNNKFEPLRKMHNHIVLNGKEQDVILMKKEI